jgi:hypothetical protein
MTKLVPLLLTVSVLIAASDYGYNGSTTGAVTLIGGIIKAKHIDKEKKYPRKDCPVCKGKGWYISGDGIKKVDCGYCEPETSDEAGNSEDKLSTLENKKCDNPNCKCENCKCKNCGCVPSVERL